MRDTPLTALSSPVLDRQLAADIAASLSRSPREIPSRYLYDDLGSALFEAICHLPWYAVTRAERGLLRRHAPAIVAAAGPPGCIVELGPGQGEKLAMLIEHGWTAPPRLSVDLIDVSTAALTLAQQRLAKIGVTDVRPWAMPYERGLAEAGLRGPAGERTETPTLTLLLGSNIGNFDPPDAATLLRQVRAHLRNGDALLLGTDLVKPENVLLRAYDDPLGVTASFNRNLLVRVNRELGATFDLSRFAHRAVWNAEASRVEMHLVSLADQMVEIPGAGLAFALGEGETIWTERSYKYRAAEVGDWLRSLGFDPIGQWRDGEAGFALTLARAV